MVTLVLSVTRSDEKFAVQISDNTRVICVRVCIPFARDVLMDVQCAHAQDFCVILRSECSGGINDQTLQIQINKSSIHFVRPTQLAAFVGSKVKIVTSLYAPVIHTHHNNNKVEDRTIRAHNSELQCAAETFELCQEFTGYMQQYAAALLDRGEVTESAVLLHASFSAFLVLRGDERFSSHDVTFFMKLYFICASFTKWIQRPQGNDTVHLRPDVLATACVTHINDVPCVATQSKEGYVAQKWADAVRESAAVHEALDMATPNITDVLHVTRALAVATCGCLLSQVCGAKVRIGPLHTGYIWSKCSSLHDAFTVLCSGWAVCKHRTA